MLWDGWFPGCSGLSEPGLIWFCLDCFSARSADELGHFSRAFDKDVCLVFVDLSEGWYLEQLLPCLGKYNLIQIPQLICLAHDDRWTRFNMSQEGEPAFCESEK